MVVGASTVLAYFYGLVPRALAFGFHEGFIGVVAATAVLVATSLVTSVPSTDAVAGFSSSWAGDD